MTRAAAADLRRRPVWDNTSINTKDEQTDAMHAQQARDSGGHCRVLRRGVLEEDTGQGCGTSLLHSWEECLASNSRGVEVYRSMHIYPDVGQLADATGLFWRTASPPYEVSVLGWLKVVLTPILLRRTKHTGDCRGKNIMQLPLKHMELVKLQFSEEERTFYQAACDKSRAKFSYVAIFALLLLQLRYACNHAFLALGRNLEEAQTQAVSSSSRHSRDAFESSVVLLFQPQKDKSIEPYHRRIPARLQQDIQQASSGGAVSKDANESSGGGSCSGGLTKSYIEKKGSKSRA